MATTSNPASNTPDAQLRSFLARFDPTLQRAFRALRTAMCTRVPTANELLYNYADSVVIAYSATEHPSDAIASIAVRDDGVRLYFNRASLLSDPQKLLKGTGKQVRYITIESASRLKDAEVAAWIVAAIANNSVPLPADGGGKLVFRSDSGSTSKRAAPKPATKKRAPTKRATPKRAK
jgi:hypothetical protein